MAWFYAQGTNGSISKMPVQVTAARRGTALVDDTNGFDDGTPLNALGCGQPTLPGFLSSESTLDTRSAFGDCSGESGLLGYRRDA